MYKKDDTVRLVHDLGHPRSRDFVPKGTVGVIAVVNTDSRWPYQVNFLGGYLPWLVEDAELVRA